MRGAAPLESGTETTGLKRRLARTEDNLRLIVQAIPNSFFYVDPHLTLELANEEFAAPLGKTVDEIHGLHIRDVFGERLYSRHAHRLEAALEGRTVVYEAKVRSLDGEQRPQSSPLADTRTDVNAVKRCALTPPVATDQGSAGVDRALEVEGARAHTRRWTGSVGAQGHCSSRRGVVRRADDGRKPSWTSCGVGHVRGEGSRAG
jgi:PAS domain S-box-containing protein